jgi:hypothetical protein
MLRIWGTEIRAIDQATGEVATFGGPNIPAPTRALAHEYCQTHGLGYCKVVDEVVSEIPCGPAPDYKPYWDKAVDYETIQSN